MRRRLCGGHVRGVGPRPQERPPLLGQLLQDGRLPGPAQPGRQHQAQRGEQADMSSLNNVCQVNENHLLGV